ncbi:MAG: hypothetical protein QOJ40_3072 [Verrucomicrobiota bacterium]
MRVLLRNTQTGLFYAGPGEWTEERTQAQDFEATDRALDTVAEAKLQAVEVLMYFEDPYFEIPMTIVGVGG